MLKTLLYFVLFINTLSFSVKAETLILTKFDVASRPYLLLKVFTDKMNALGNEKYIISVVPGANGEAAMNRAISLSNTRNMLLFGGPSNFVYSEIDPRNSERYREQFRYVKLIGRSFTSIFVHKNTKIETIEELINRLKNRSVIYHASTERVNNPFTLNDIFIRTAKLPPARSLRYKTYGEMVKALEQGEADYGLMSLENENDLTMLMNSSINLSTPLSGLSLSFPDFVHELGLMFYTLRNEPKYDVFLRDINTVCTIHQSELKNISSKINYVFDCVEGEKELNERVQRDIIRIEKSNK